MTNLFSLEGKNAWITGASYGIGFNIAKAFVEAGIQNIIFNDISEAALERGLNNYKEAGITNVHGYVCDVTKEDDVKALVEKIHEEVGQIDILVNNAGIIKRIPMHEMKRSEFQAVIDVDLVAPFIVASAVLPEMMERREGKIINICSMMSELGRETVSAYAAAKGGLKMLTRNICSEYGEYNIQCNGIGPGYIATPQFHLREDPGWPLARPVRTRRSRRIPRLPRLRRRERPHPLCGRRYPGLHRQAAEIDSYTSFGMTKD